MEQVIRPGFLSGTIRIPASKSDSQRAILCAALASGTSVLRGIGQSDDEKAMLNAVIAMGATVNFRSDSDLELTGIQKLPGNLELQVGESGLGLRLLTCVCAGFEQEVQLNGKGSLLNRPMHFFDEVLPLFGCQVVTNNGFLPLQVRGPLQGGDREVDGSMSSQFISGLLMALPGSSSPSTLRVKEMRSGPYIQMTLRTLKHFGIRIEQTGHEFFIPGNQSYQAVNYTIEGDWSSAGYWLVAAAVGNPVSVSGLNMASLQADKALLNGLMGAGCKIDLSGGGIRVDGTALSPFEFDATNCPDLFPALVVLAAKCEGISTIRGVGRLVHKESNRGEALREEFAKMGLRIEIDGDSMQVYGTGSLRGAVVNSHHDHRIAMCLAIAGSFASGETIIRDAEAVSKSYPEFWRHLESLRQ